MFFLLFSMNLPLRFTFYQVTSATVCDSFVRGRDRLMHVTENKENTSLKLIFGNNTHTGIAESCLAGQGETWGLSTGFKILWGIIPAYLNV